MRFFDHAQAGKPVIGAVDLPVGPVRVNDFETAGMGV
jgi:hypothetical protein